MGSYEEVGVMEAKAHSVTLIGRALKKYPYSKNTLFVDFAYGENSLPIQYRTSHVIHQPSYAIGSVVVMKLQENEPFPTIVSGDVICVKGYIQNTEEAFVQQTERPSIVAHPKDIVVLEPWPMKEYGFFSFEARKFVAPSDDIPTLLSNDNHTKPDFIPASRRLQKTIFPCMIIQCRQRVAERVIGMIQQKYCVHNKITLRESTTCHIKSSDRLVILTDETIDDVNHTPETSSKLSDQSNTKHKELILQMISDVIIGPAILRIYPGAFDAALAYTCHTQLTTALDLLFTQLQSLEKEGRVEWSKECTAIRLHAYPKAIADQIRLQYTLPVDLQSLPWNSQVYSHVLSMLMVDGVWLVSLVKAQDTFIGDLREQKAKPTVPHPLDLPMLPVVLPEEKSAEEIQALNEQRLAAYQPSKGTSDTPIEPLKLIPPFHKASLHPTINTPIMFSICRASGKIEEIMLANHWILDAVSDSASAQSESQSQLHQYSVALDIGASPGGWTYYLALQVSVQRIISIDKGELLLPKPWPNTVEHWRVTGEEAIATIMQQHAEDSDSIAPSSSFQPNKVEKHSIDLFCCDANIAPILCIQFLFQCQALQLLATETRFIITFKNIYTRKDDWERAIQLCLHQLERHGCVEVKLRHLLANTAKETTCTGLLRADATIPSLASLSVSSNQDQDDEEGEVEEEE